MELIKITTQNGNKAVSARELHQFLESKQQFGNWIENRINEYGFVENQDYSSFNNIIKRETGATTRIEYIISMDMAKELAMVELTEKGKLARLYFIECEKIAKSEPTIYLDATPGVKLTQNLQRLNLGHQIKQNLLYGDINELATELAVRRQFIHKVLNGQSVSERVLKACHERAVTNKQLKKLKYNQMLAELKNN